MVSKGKISALLAGAVGRTFGTTAELIGLIVTVDGASVSLSARVQAVSYEERQLRIHIGPIRLGHNEVRCLEYDETEKGWSLILCGREIRPVVLSFSAAHSHQP